MDLFRLRTVALMVPSKLEKMPNAIKATISAKLPKAMLGAKHVGKNPWEKNPRYWVYIPKAIKRPDFTTKTCFVATVIVLLHPKD